MRRMLRKADRETKVAVLLIVALGIVFSYFGGLGWAPTRATLALEISNETGQPLSNVTNLMSLILPERFNLSVLPENTANLTFMRVSGPVHQFQIQIVYIAAHSTVDIELQDIYPIAVDYSDLVEADVSARFGNVPANVSYSLQFMVLRDTPIGTLSMGSSYYSQSASGIQTPTYDLRDRFYTHFLYYPFAALAILTLLWIPLSRKSETLKRQYPFTTFLIASSSLLLYVFVGSGWEANTLLNWQQSGWHFLPILGPLFHASYSHITGNLPLFLIIGTASEWVASAGVANAKQNTPRFAVFFLLPLLYSSYGYGLSFVIEMMAVFLLAYAVVNRKVIARSAWMVGVVFVSGLTLTTFYGWFTYAVQLVFWVLQGSWSVAFALSDYNTREAFGHIWATILAAAIAWLLCILKPSKKKGWKARINNLGYLAFKEPR